jgi:hypothetical protein
MVDAPSPLRRSARGATIHAAAGVAQLVEHQLPKLRVVGSSPIARFCSGGSGGPLRNVAAQRATLVD